MQVIKAAAYGLCFGVRDALDAAFARTDACEVTVYGELVHNETVIDRLATQGYHQAPEQGRESAIVTDKVLITAHGISNTERVRLTASGKELIDTTCPLVQKVHNAALRLQDAGYHVVVIGKHGHVEVRGVIGDLTECTVVETVAEAAALRLTADRIGVVSQTTIPVELAEAIVAELKRVHPRVEVRFVDTICEPTRQRRAAIQELLKDVDRVVVVGGKNSNNTRRLVEACLAEGVPAVRVQGPSDLDPEWFRHCRTVGLTAGTSTLDEVVDAVEAALHALAPPVQEPAPASSLADR